MGKPDILIVLEREDFPLNRVNPEFGNDFQGQPFYESSVEIGKAIRKISCMRHGIEHLRECIQRHGAVVLAGIMYGLKQ